MHCSHGATLIYAPRRLFSSLRLSSSPLLSTLIVLLLSLSPSPSVELLRLAHFTFSEVMHIEIFSKLLCCSSIRRTVQRVVRCLPSYSHFKHSLNSPITMSVWQSAEISFWISYILLHLLSRRVGFCGRFGLDDDRRCRIKYKLYIRWDVDVRISFHIFLTIWVTKLFYDSSSLPALYVRMQSSLLPCCSSFMLASLGQFSRSSSLACSAALGCANIKFNCKRLNLALKF